MKQLTASIASFLLALLPLAQSVTAQDIAITTKADRKKVKIGEYITFTITVTNLGHDTATGIVFGDPLPATLELVSFSCPAGTRVYPSFCYVASLAGSASQTITLVATPILNPTKSQRRFLSTASIVACETSDANIDNNTASVRVRINGRINQNH